MAFRHDNDQIFRSGRRKLYTGLLFCHRTEPDVIFFVFQALYYFRGIAHSKPEFHIQLFMCMNKIAHKLRDKFAPQRIDIGKFDHAFRLAGK